ncbi:carbohydrate ABC transporter permease [Kibdelosporangium phytohabitans]|uniref:Sugar ABC transporter permease n=1 Tax=Kibdelosporangium phytohabitans TaxID=860235 RepID=A0A0N9IG83_9PSEU|nr:carbohydrate ABC transporter permease [Kibdelosporangium phytohabitans]ALG15561.1 sugar ABC transporter permease [Kibdelosporangium phytohabitans]MBE1464932.1 raffinose/stachyose/melibiose transport system permease protein [Kibdelosporangium phytohabitans]
MTVSRAERVGTYLVLGVFTIFALYPMLSIIFTALRPEVAGRGGIHWENFGRAWSEARFGSYLFSSLIVSVSVVAITVVLSVLAAYAFGTMSFRGRDALFYLLLLGLTVPSEAVVVPLYYDLRDLGLTDTYASLILPQVAQSVAFGAFWMRTYFRSTSRSVVEAARLDGAGHWQTLWRVLVPMGRPALVTLIVLVFMWTWNEFLLARVMITGEALRTAPLGLQFFSGRSDTSVPLLAAASVLVALPVVVVYLFLQRHFIRGMVDGAVKG